MHCLVPSTLEQLLFVCYHMHTIFTLLRPLQLTILTGPTFLWILLQTSTQLLGMWLSLLEVCFLLWLSSYSRGSVVVASLLVRSEARRYLTLGQKVPLIKYNFQIGLPQNWMFFQYHFRPFPYKFKVFMCVNLLLTVALSVKFPNDIADWIIYIKKLKNM